MGREIPFERFWGIVWAKIGKGSAKKAWLRKVTSKEIAEAVIAAAISQGPGLISHAAANGHSVLHPTTWLNAERWTDEQPSAPKGNREPECYTPEQTEARMAYNECLTLEEYRRRNAASA